MSTEEVKPLIIEDNNGIIVKSITVEQEQKDQVEEKQEQQQLVVEEQKVESSLLLELLELEFKGEKVEYPIAHAALQYLLKSDLFFKDANERVVFFRDLEVSYSRIIQDGRIDARDIPELLNVTKNMYNKFSNNMLGDDTLDKFDTVKSMLVLSMKIYLGMVNIHDINVLALFENIVSPSLELLKENSITIQKKSTIFSGLLCC
jgi:hypothetical protein